MALTPGHGEREDDERRTTHTTVIESCQAETIVEDTGRALDRPEPRGNETKRSVAWRARMMQRRLLRMHGGKVQGG